MSLEALLLRTWTYRSGVNKTHLSIPSIDIFSNHFYPPNNTKLADDIALVGSVNKVYLAAEYSWTLNPDAIPLEDFFGTIESQQAKSRPVVAGGKQASRLHAICNAVRMIFRLSPASAS